MVLAKFLAVVRCRKKLIDEGLVSHEMYAVLFLLYLFLNALTVVMFHSLIQE